MCRWSFKVWLAEVFYGLISIISVIVLAFALPTGITRIDHEVEPVLGGSRIVSGTEIPPPEILRFMRRFGYLAGNGGAGNIDAETLYHESAIVEAIKNVQKYGALKQTGQLDNETLNLLNSPRCGVPDIEGTPYYLMSTASQRTRQKRYVIGARPWEKRRIRYFFANWSYRIPRVQIERDFARALQLWSRYANLHFIRVNSTTADIIVGFGTGYHGDGFPFDGPGGVLAHAYYPYDQGSFGGDIHFDEDENWLGHFGNLNHGIDFYAVAAHEIGHSLGLAHSSIATSIMFPYYKGYVQALDADDVRAMREIYFDRSLPDDGSIYREVFISPNPTTTEPTFEKPNSTETLMVTFKGDYETVAKHKERYGHALNTINSSPPILNESLQNNLTPDVCSGDFDAVTTIRNSVHIFKRSHVWKLTANYTVFTDYPKTIFEVFPFYKNTQIKTIDAAYERNDDTFVLFSGSMYWLLNTTTTLVISSGPLTDFLGSQSDISNVNAAMLWPKNNLTYIFADSKFWRYNDRLKTVHAGYPKSLRRWPGIPNNIDAAATLSNGKTYFFKSNLYWLYNNKILRPEQGYPRLIGPAWLKNICS